jgi:hypothetical protein
MLGEGHTVIMSGKDGNKEIRVVIKIVPTEEIEHLFAEGEALLALINGTSVVGDEDSSTVEDDDTLVLQAEYQESGLVVPVVQSS